MIAEVTHDEFLNFNFSKEDSEELWVQIVDIVETESKPAELFHYTSTQALERICTTNELLLSDARYLNDSSEIEHGVVIAKEALSGLDQSTKDERLRSLAKIVDSAVSILTEASHRPFVFSLSEEGDSLEQWRGYGGRSAVAIGFSADIEAVQPVGKAIHSYTSLARVEYSIDRQRKIVEDVLDSIATFADRPRREPKGGDGGTSILGVTINSLMQIIPTFKHNSFHNEREWRLIRMIMDPVEHRADVVRHSVREGLLVPNTFVRNPEGRLPISSVRCGPNSVELTLSSVGSLLRATGYNVPVTKSVIPYRTSGNVM